MVGEEGGEEMSDGEAGWENYRVSSADEGCWEERLESG